MAKILSDGQSYDLQYDERGKYKYLVLFSMLCMAIILCKELFSYRLVALGGHVIQAGQLISPLWFLICDMMTEIYGYPIARQALIAGFVCQILFTLACSGLNSLPFPVSWHEFAAYQSVFGDLWRVNAAVLVAFAISGFINIRLLSRWKILLKGQYFWLRSIGSSAVGELLFSFLATFAIQYGKQDFRMIFDMIVLSFLLKAAYSIVLSVPANVMVYFVKKAEQIEAFPISNTIR